ncbi:hypothetical protein D3C84_1146420 [compost metagenome]
MIEQPGVGGEVGARGAADGLLVHLHQPLDRVEPSGNAPAAGLHGFVFQALLIGFGVGAGLAQVGADQIQQGLADEAGFA